jgi:hypothetical protein
MVAPMTRQLIWTVVPAGRVATIDAQPMALFSLLLTPRLLGPSDQPLQLNDFGLQTWPQRVAAVTFSAQRGGAPLPAGAKIRRVPYLGIDGTQIQFSIDQQSSAWGTMFPPDMLVRPYQSTSYSGRPVVEFPASQAGAQISTAYSGSTQALATLHPGEPIALRESLRTVNESWQTGLSAPDQPTDQPSPLRQAYDFYRRPGTDAPPPADVHDFHDVVSRLADHPMLLRALGLLIDLAVPASALAPSDTPMTLQVIPAWPNPDLTAPPGWADAAQQDLSPSTAYTLEGSRFLPATDPGPQAAPFTGGMLAAADAAPAGAGGNPRFEIMPFDVDGAVLRMVSVATADAGQPAPAQPDHTGLPALRTAGFALIDIQRTAEHTNRLQRAEQRASTAGLLGSPLTADNLISGYRVDIFDDHTQQWRSLCRRRMQYSVGDVQIGTADAGLLDEGSVRVDSVTTGADDDSLYVHQAIARWDGWSLVGSRPERIADPIITPPQPFTVAQTHDPGSLPRLRFGRNYRLRVRLADIAGGGLQLEEPGIDEQQSQLFTHRRFEPIAAPELLPTRPYLDGESQAQLVIRSDRATSATAYAAAHGYRPDDQRYLFAPKAALDLAIQHGDFDAALGAAQAGTVDQYFALATRADRDQGDITGAQLHDDATPSGGGHYIVPETHVTLPWLPDPACSQMALNLRPRAIDPDTGQPAISSGFDDDHHQHRWIGRWPDYAPIALKLVAGEPGCAATMDTASPTPTLTIALGPAEQATMDVVSCPRSDGIDALGVAMWAGAKPDDSTDPVTTAVLHGRARTVTPPHTITVVHAVQRPLIDPGGKFVGSRQTGDTDAVLRTTELQLHIASTGRIDVHAEWTDLDDNVSQPAPTSNSFATHVGSYDVAYDRADKALPTITQTFADTRRRQVTHSVTAISRYRDYFGHITSAQPDACTVAALLAQTDIPSSMRPPAPRLRYAIPAFGWTRDNSGGVHRSTRSGGAVRVYLERPWFVTGVDEALAVIVSAGFDAPHLSVAGQDPVHATSAPQSPLQADHVIAPGTAQTTLPESTTVTAMIYPVTFDEQMNCWTADLDLSRLADTSYCPFVRLSLCRYQELSIADVPSLSPPVETEPLQLLPRRDLTISTAANQISVVLNGISSAGAAPNTVNAQVQVTDSPAASADDALIGPSGWTTVTSTSGPLGNALQLNLTDTTTRPLRVLVTETENYPSQNLAPGTEASRLIYAETVRLR